MSDTEWFKYLAAVFYDREMQKLFPPYDKFLSSGDEYVEK